MASDDTPIPAAKREIDASDPDHVRAVADALHVKPEIIEEAIQRVGPNLTAVELWLTAPRS
jgi:hypothetical protein